MPEPSLESDPAPDAFEDLLTQMLDAMEVEGPRALERLCADHPAHADRLRAHARRLSDWGLLAVGATRGPAPGVPERLGDYRLLRRLGGGGMGNVYVAEQVALRRRVALKLIRPEQVWLSSARERFAREVHAIAKLQHPGIVPVHDAGESAGLPWLAMELVDGASLDEVLTEVADRAPDCLTGADLEHAVDRIVAGRRDPLGAPLTASATRPALFTGTWVAACLRIARAVADALVHAHERGVLHRDVKPSNVMLTLDGRVLLLDFGLARSDGSARLTQDQSQLGSPAYMSPEQVRGDLDVDARTDVWSLGVLLCETLMLRAPFADASVERTRTLVLEAKEPAIRRRNPAVARDVEHVCWTATSGDRERRYATMRAFAADLDNLLEKRPVQARPPTPWLVLRRWAQRRPATAIGIVAAVLVLLVAPTVFWQQQRAANASIRDALATAEQHRDRADKARLQAQKDRDAAREVVQQWLTRVGAEELVDVPHMQGLRRDLLDAASGYHERFLADAGDDPALLEQATESAIQLATIRMELGETVKASAVTARAVALAQRLSSARGRDRVSLTLLAQAKALAAYQEHAAGRSQLAHDLLDQAIPLQREAMAAAPDDTGLRTETMSLLRTAALVANALDLEDEAAQRYAEVQAVFAADDARIDEPRGLRQMSVGASADEAYFHLRRGRIEDAERAAQRVIAWRHTEEPAHLTSIERVAAARAFDVVGRIRRRQGDPIAAEASAREALAEAEAVLADLPQHANARRIAAGALNSLAFVVATDRARRAEAHDLYERSIAAMRQVIALDPAVVEPRVNLATSLVNLAAMRIDDDELVAARTMLDEAIDLTQRGLDAMPSNQEAAATLFNAVWFLGQLAGRQRDHRTQVDAANRLASLQPDDARTQRIAGALIAEACASIGADTAIAADERDTLLAARQQDALRLLDRAADLGAREHEYLATHTHLAAVRDLPAFAAIVAKMKANAERSPAGR